MDARRLSVFVHWISYFCIPNAIILIRMMSNILCMRVDTYFSDEVLLIDQEPVLDLLNAKLDQPDAFV